MATLAEIRAKLKEQEQHGSDSNRRAGDNSIYPFWNLKEEQESVVRFLPDGDQDNMFFWVERAMIRLPFAGVKGSTDNKQLVVQVPCVEMYNDGSVCPILSEVRGWFKDKNLEEMGKKYWKKRSYIFQALVVEDGLKEEEAPENPIRRLPLGPQIYQLVRRSLMDPELEELPTDYIRGVDFKLSKTSKGGYADYSTSVWKRRERPLSDVERAAISSFGLNNLKDFLPKKPTEVELRVMQEMFEASVDGEAYDLERWGQYFKPSNLTIDAGSAEAFSAKTRAKPQPQKSAPIQTATSSAPPWESNDDAFEENAEPVRVSAATKAPDSKPSGGRAEDILQMIRSRKQ